MFARSVLRVLARSAEAAALLVGPVASRVMLRQATDIRLERQRRALASTAEFVDRHLSDVKPASGPRGELLRAAFQKADVSGERLICEFGVFEGSSINQIAALTSKMVFGFDSFEGLPEDWSTMGIGKGHFAVRKLPRVRENVSLIKGWFNESIPPFLAQQKGMVGFLHIDCDLYSSTRTVLEMLTPRLGPGAVIVFDEYFNFPGWQQGEHLAFTEFLQKSGLSCEYIGFHCKSQQVAAVLR